MSERRLQSESSMGSANVPTEKPNSSPIFQKIYGVFGFRKAYNFVLWFIFGGAMVGFALARFMFLHPPTMLEKIAPGEAYHMSTHLYKTAMLIHLATVLPAGILATLQFIPLIRYKALIVHRVCGYVALLLLVMGAASGFALGRRSFGGDFSIQTGVVVLGASVLVSAALAYYNIKRLQIDQHRKWMLRTWFYAGSIITLRILQIIMAKIASDINQYHTVWSCNEVDFMLKNATEVAQMYPLCATNQHNGYVVVPAIMTSAIGAGSSLRFAFGPALWMALFIHATGIEIYIHLTPGEAERLRKVSYEKQLERGAKYPGSMGTTSDRAGDNFGVRYRPH